MPIDGDDNAKKINPLTVLPKEIILTIFSYLNANELGRISRLNTQCYNLVSDWNALDLDLRNISPLLSIFDQFDWKTYFNLTVDDVPPLNKHAILPLLKKCLSSLPIEKNAGITLLTIPKKLTLNNLITLAGSLKKKRNITKFRYILKRITSEVGDTPVDKTYQIIITNNILKNSRKLSFHDQKVLVKENGCKIPKLLEIVALLVARFTGFGERLYNDKPWTYTRTLEQIDDLQCIAGGFSEDGVHISNYSGADNDYNGAGGVLWIEMP